MNNLQIHLRTVNNLKKLHTILLPCNEKKKKKRDTYSSISSHSYQTISTMTSLKNNHTWHFTAMQSLDSLAETTAVVRLLHAIIMSSNSRHEISPTSLHDVNNWLPSVTMAVPSPMNVVMDISVSRIRSSSVATSLILGRRLDDGFKHWKARPTSSFIPSAVKLPANLGSISSFELKCASIFRSFDVTRKMFFQWAVSKRNILMHEKLQHIFQIVIFL